MTIPRLQSCILEAFRSNEANPATQSKPTQMPAYNDNMFCEVMTHPGNRTGNSGGCGDGPDDFSQSSDRVHEMKLLMSEEMMQFYEKEDFKIVSFNSLKV